MDYPAANFHHSTTVEIIWTIIPIFILVGMAYPATKTVIAMKDTSSPEITIKATGYQWKWGYDYLTGEGEGISFLSNLPPLKAQIENVPRPRARITCWKLTTAWWCRWARRYAYF